MATAKADQSPGKPGAPASEEYQPTEEELDTMIATALDCPCVKDLRESPCGEAFKAAFTCFHKSMDVPKGHGCSTINDTFMECLRQHPEALASFQSAAEEGSLAIPAGPPDSQY